MATGPLLEAVRAGGWAVHPLRAFEIIHAVGVELLFKGFKLALL